MLGKALTWPGRGVAVPHMGRGIETERRGNLQERFLNWAGRSVARSYASSMLKMDVQHHVSLPGGPKIIAANHPTTTDPFAMMGLVSEPISMLITESCFKIPVLGRFLQGAGHVKVAHGHGRAALEEGKRLLHAGRTVGIFPEGSLSPLEGGVCLAHTGVARLALSTGAPVIPVGIYVQREFIRFVKTEIAGQAEGIRWYLDGPYVVTIGEPMWFEGDVGDRDHVRSVLEQIMQRILQLSNESARRMSAAQTRVSGMCPQAGCVGA